MERDDVRLEFHLIAYELMQTFNGVFEDAQTQVFELKSLIEGKQSYI